MSNFGSLSIIISFTGLAIYSGLDSNRRHIVDFSSLRHMIQILLLTLSLSIGEDSIFIKAGIPPDLKIDNKPLGEPEIAWSVPARHLILVANGEAYQLFKMKQVILRLN